MKYMKVLPNIKLTNLFGEEFKDENGKSVHLSFKDFVLQRLADPKFSKNMDSILSAVQIKNAIENIKEDEVLGLETSDWKNLADAVKEPSPQTPYNSLMSHALLPFMQEIVNAKDTKLEG